MYMWESRVWKSFLQSAACHIEISVSSGTVAVAGDSGAPTSSPKKDAESPKEGIQSREKQMLLCGVVCRAVPWCAVVCRGVPRCAVGRWCDVM